MHARFAPEVTEFLHRAFSADLARKRLYVSQPKAGLLGSTLPSSLDKRSGFKKGRIEAITRTIDVEYFF